MKPPQFWNTLTNSQKKACVYGTIVLSIVLISIIGYQFSDKETVVQKKEVTQKKIISMEGDQLEKGLYLQTEMKLEQQKEAMQNEIKRLRTEFDTFKKENLSEKPETPNTPKTIIPIKQPLPLPMETPPPPSPPMKLTESQTIKPTNAPPPPLPTAAKEPAWVGGIEVIRSPSGEDTGKKNSEEIYLPPSFMRGTLLTGVAAPSISGAKNAATPMLFKINNLAILPNSVRADLKGCFVVAEGTGDLSTERVKTRLLTLSCVTKNGESIIDQEVKGFVVDADGQVDLKGEPVAKMGMHLARVGLAGLLGGAAEGIEQSAFVSQFSAATGITEKTLKDDSDAILKLGVGRGVADTAKELKSFYLQLAQQTLPVIEVGPTKQVNLVISQGVGLKIIEKHKEAS